MNKFKQLLLIFILPCAILLSACSLGSIKPTSDLTMPISSDNLIESLKGKDGKDGTNGTNGLNGTNGVDGDSIDLFEVYSKLVELDQFDGTYAEFVKEYLGKDENVYATSKALRSCVSIYAGFSADVLYSDMYGTLNQFTQKHYSTGSGVIYSINYETGDAIIVTNYHVVYDHSSNTKISDDINLLLYGNNEYKVSTKEYVIDYRSYTKYAYTEFSSQYAIKATYLGGSLEYDIAVLKVSGSELMKNTDLLEAKFADSNELTVGEKTIAVGNAASLGISATVGCVSVDSEYLSMVGADDVTTCKFRVIRTDSAVNPGNSGGGLFNSKGELIGIVNAKTSSEKIENIGYAIPSNVVKYVVNNIIKNCDGNTKTSVIRCMFGLTIAAKTSALKYDAATLKTYIKEEVMVVSTTKGGLCDGKIQEGTIIKSVDVTYSDGSTLHLDLDRTFYLVDLSLTLSVGDIVTFNLIDENGNSLTPLTLTLTQACISICK